MLSQAHRPRETLRLKGRNYQKPLKEILESLSPKPPKMDAIHPRAKHGAHWHEFEENWKACPDINKKKRDPSRCWGDGSTACTLNLIDHRIYSALLKFLNTLYTICWLVALSTFNCAPLYLNVSPSEVSIVKLVV